MQELRTDLKVVIVKSEQKCQHVMQRWHLLLKTFYSCFMPALKRYIAFFISLTHFYSGCVCAQGPLSILGEQFNVPNTRSYVGQAVAIVEPTTFNEEKIQNIFDEIKISEKGGVIFKTTPQTSVIYNRGSSQNPAELSGLVTADKLTRMVFSNPGGLMLENPEFDNISDLTLVAGEVAKTNKGMAVGINTGLLEVTNTTLSAQDDVKDLTLIGGAIHLNQTILDPQESIRIKVGSSYLPSQKKDALVLDSATILRSKVIRIDSLQVSATLSSYGLMQTTEGDIVVNAVGDVYLSKLLAVGNLIIRTSGKVILGDDVIAGGQITIKAQDITLEKPMEAKGAIRLTASNRLSIKEYISSEDKINLIGRQAVDLKGSITAREQLTAFSEGIITQEGLLESAHSLKIKAQALKKNGKVISDGYINITTERELENLSQRLIAAEWGKLTSTKGVIVNRGELQTGLNLALRSQQADNYGSLHTSSTLETTGSLTNHTQGYIKAQSYSNLSPLLLANRGMIESEAPINANIDKATLKGHIKTQGSLALTGKELTIEGMVEAAQGGLLKLEKFTNKGSLTLYGVLQGTIGTVTNHGDIEAYGLQARFEDTHNYGTLRTRGHLSLQGSSFQNYDKGAIFTCGVHQMDMEGYYIDSGKLYTPTLLLLKANNLEFKRAHRSILKDGLINAGNKLTLNEGAEIALPNHTDKCFLQLTSGSDLSFHSKVAHYSTAPYPYLDYFTLVKRDSKDSLPLRDDFAKEIAAYPLQSWIAIKKNLGSGLAFNAGRDLHYKGSAKLESGSVRVHANGKLESSQGTLQAGYFTGNNVSVQAAKAILDHSTLKSLFGNTHMSITHDLSSTHSTFMGEMGAKLEAKNLLFNHSNIESPRGTVFLLAHDSANLKDTSLKAKRGNAIHVVNQLDMKRVTIEGEKNTIEAKDINAKKLALKGNTRLDAKRTLTIDTLTSRGKLQATSGEKTTFAGIMNVEDISAQSKQITNNARLMSSNSAYFKADIIEQNNILKAGQNLILIAEKQYKDFAHSLNEAGQALVLEAQENDSFQGRNKADIAVIKVRNMQLLDLLDKVEARETEAHLTSDVILNCDLTLNTTLKLWANRLENRAKLTANEDFIAHLQTSFLNEGIIKIQGKGGFSAESSITNTGEIASNEGLSLHTKGALKHTGIFDGGEGTLSIDANSIEANMDPENPNRIPHFKGKNIQMESATYINARGAEFTSNENTSLKAKGDINLNALVYNVGDHRQPAECRQTTLNIGGNFHVETEGKFLGQALNAPVTGSIFINAKKGVDLNSLASVYTADEWNYNTGLFGQNNHRGFREDAKFFQTNLTSKTGNINIVAKEGGIKAQGTAFNARGEIYLDARDNIDLSALKADVRYASHNETDLSGILGSIDDKEGTVTQFKVMQALSNKAIRVFSRQGKIEGEAPIFLAPELELDGEKGIIFKPLELNSIEASHHYENNLNLYPTNIEFEHKEQHTRTGIMQQLAGLIRADFLKIRTGKNAEALFASTITGFKEGGKTDMEVDTDKLAFTGTKSTMESTSDAWRLAISIDVDLVPGGGFDISHDRLAKAVYTATQQNIGTCTYKRKGATLIVKGGAQTSINLAQGESFHVHEDKDALEREAQEGYAMGANFSSTSVGAHASAKWGEKTSADKLTNLTINTATTEVTRTVNTRCAEVRDTRGGFGVGFQMSDKGASVSVNAQVGGTKMGIAAPLDEKGLQKANPLNVVNDLTNIKDLKSLNTAVTDLANANQTLNNLGVNTGDVEKGLSRAQQLTSAATRFERHYNAATLQSDSANKSGSEFLHGASDFLESGENCVAGLQDITAAAKAMGAKMDDIDELLGSAGSVLKNIHNGRELPSVIVDRSSLLTDQRDADAKAATRSAITFPAKRNDKEGVRQAVDKLMKKTEIINQEKLKLKNFNLIQDM